MRQASYLLILVLVSLVSCGSSEKLAERRVRKCLSTHNPKVLEASVRLEAYLIDHRHIKDWSKGELLMLLTKLKDREVKIDRSDIYPDYGDEVQFYTPMAFARWTECFRAAVEEAKDLMDESKLKKVNDAIHSIVVTNDLVCCDEQMFEPLTEEDLRSDIYRISMFFMIWSRLDRS